MRAEEQAVSRCGEIKSRLIYTYVYMYICGLGLKLKLCFGLQRKNNGLLHSRKARRQGHRSHKGEDAAQGVEDLLA